MSTVLGTFYLNVNSVIGYSTVTSLQWWAVSLTCELINLSFLKLLYQIFYCHSKNKSNEDNILLYIVSRS